MKSISPTRKPSQSCGDPRKMKPTSTSRGVSIRKLLLHAGTTPDTHTVCIKTATKPVQTRDNLITCSNFGRVQYTLAPLLTSTHPVYPYLYPRKPYTPAPLYPRVLIPQRYIPQQPYTHRHTPTPHIYPRPYTHKFTPTPHTPAPTYTHDHTPQQLIPARA